MKIAILGYGTIGSGVYNVFTTNAEEVEKRAGETIEVKYVLDLREFPGDPAENILVHDYKTIVNDPEVECVVETMGGDKPAYTFVKECILAGKSVTTSNKEMVANHGPELVRLAKEKGVNFFFEASVGGAIPIIRPINESFSADEILEIRGIINGTTNYILTKMDHEGTDYETALAEAQDKGYAERNPEADVEGYDPARKIAILSSIACGRHVDYNDIYTEGITKLTAFDFEYARHLGKAIKLIASMRKENGDVFASVSPMLIDTTSPLFTVNDVFNGILVNGKYSGTIMFYGRGAGSLPTASAVAADVVEIARNRGNNELIIWSDEKQPVTDRLEERNDFFVRVASFNKQKARDAFGEVEDIKPLNGEYAFIVRNITEAEYESAASRVRIINKLRILNA